MTKAILRKDWFFEVWEKWKINPSEVEKERGTHPFGKPSWTELFEGQHPEVMKNHPRFLQYIDKYKLKINMSVFPSQIEGFTNVSLKEKDIFNIKLTVGETKPYLILIDDLLEHISYNAVGEFLVRIFDQMELHGEIIIKTLNMQEIIKRFVEGNIQYVDFIQFLYGKQKESFDYHSCIYDQNAIKVLLEDVGFENITIQTIENNTFLYVVGRKNREFR